MKTELNEQDRQRIEQKAWDEYIYFKEDFIKGAEYEHNYQRVECNKIIERATADQTDTILILDQKVKQLEAERSELNGKVARLEAAVWMLLHHIPDTPDMEPIREKCKTELNSLKTK